MTRCKCHVIIVETKGFLLMHMTVDVRRKKCSAYVFLFLWILSFGGHLLTVIKDSWKSKIAQMIRCKYSLTPYSQKTQFPAIPVRPDVAFLHLKFSAILSLKPLKIPFITLIGTDEEASTLFTTSNELVKLGFIGVSTVRGGFEAVKYEVEQG